MGNEDASRDGRIKITQQMASAELVRQAMERMRKLFRIGAKVELRDFFQLCILLAKAIDSAVAYNQVPALVHDLPQLVKQVFERKDDIRLQPAVMVLMLSVKNACRSGWFRITDTDELLTMSKELSSRFTSTGEVSTSETNNAMHIISRIIPRFYPRLSLGCILVSFEAKPGYEVLVTDFHIAKRPVPHEKIRLFVVRVDNLETSACLVTPPQVNFLLNGKGVEKRSIVSMDTGPQMPTDVTGMLKIGTNLLQAIGEFTGHYIIAITVMSTMSSSPSTKLCDYVAPSSSSILLDDEVIEGPSRISLHCPISYKRIVTPVKGSMCRHHQCFDYENFMEINSRRPSWRCPHCNTHVSCPDLRLDQMMVKVLKEAGEDVADVLISGDGSWKIISASDNMKDKLPENNDIDEENALVSRDAEGKVLAANDVIDLTIEDDERQNGTVDLGMLSNGLQSPANVTNAWHRCRDFIDTEDRKPDLEFLRRISLTDSLLNASLSNPVAHTGSRANAHVAADTSAGDRFLVSTSNGVSMMMPRWERFRTGASESSPSNNVFTAVLTDAISPALNRTPIETRNLTQTGNPLQSMSLNRHFLPAENRDLHLAHSVHGNSITGAESERHSSRFISRAPIAIQALPAQTQVVNSFTRPRMSVFRSNSTTQVGASSNTVQLFSPLTSLADGFEAAAFSMDPERQQLLSRQQQSLQAILDRPTSSPVHFQSQSNSQNRELQERQHQLVHSFQPSMTMQTPIQGGGRNNLDQQRLSAGRHSFQLSQDQNQQQQRSLNQWIQQTSIQHDTLLRHPQRVPPLQFQQVPHSGLGSSSVVSDSSAFAPLPVLNQHPHTTPRTVPNARPSAVQFSRSLPTSGLTFQRSSAAPVMSWTDGSQEGGLEQTWRPTGRMRGSIVVSGRVGNSGSNPYLSQQVSSGHTRTLVGSSQSAVHLSSLGSANSNVIQRPPLNTWNGDLVNTSSLWNSNDGALLRPAGSNMSTQVQAPDQNNNASSLPSPDFDWIALQPDIQMPPNDGSQMLG